LLRIGFPVFDRIGNAHRRMVGYRGTMDLIFEIANIMIDRIEHHHPGDWPLTPEALHAATGVPAAGGDEISESTITTTNLATASA
jgi:nitrogenase molybdenum-iron protein NifN